VQASPPPIVALSPGIPADFSIDHVRPDNAGGLLRAHIDCPNSGADEIVVCGRGTARMDRLRSLPALPEEPIAMERLRDKMTLHIGSATLGPGCFGKCAGIGLRIPF